MSAGSGLGEERQRKARKAREPMFAAVLVLDECCLKPFLPPSLDKKTKWNCIRKICFGIDEVM